MDNGRISVLLIEDDQDDYLLTYRLLKGVESPQFDVDWANTFEDGLEAILDGQYDLALVDFRLGERNGLELLHTAVANGCRMPIIMLTGMDSRETDVEAMEAGASDFLEKNQLTTRLLERSIRYAIERKHAEMMVRKSEEGFRALLESAPDAMVVVDSHGSIRLVNSQTEKLFGYARKELLGQAVEMLIPEPFRSRHPAARQGYYLAPHVRSMGVGLELYAQRKDGDLFPVEISLSPIETEEGILIASAVRDITERKRSEAIVRKNEERFRALLESAPDAIVIVNQKGSIELVNSQTETLFGYTREELLGQAVEMLIPESFRSRHPALRQHYNAEPHLRIRGGGLDLYALRKDGDLFPVEINLSPIETEEGILIVSVVRDITERRLAEKRALELSIEREKVRLLTSFIEYSSHDFRTPLTSMSLSLYIARRTNDTHQQQQKLDTIERDIYKLTSIIEEMQLLTKLESGFGVNIKPVSLDHIVEPVPTDVQMTMDEKLLSLHLASREGITVIGDGELLRRAFHSVLDNAALYTPERGSISVSTYVEDRWGVIEVADTGVGIENSKLEAIFDFFTKINIARTADGSGAGLGLAIVKKIMDVHNGKVAVTSHPGLGSTFCLMLPLSE